MAAKTQASEVPGVARVGELRTPDEPAEHETIDATLGKCLQSLRKSRNLRLTDMSALTGLTVSALSKVENGKLSLNFKTVVKLSIDLGVPMASLLGVTSVREMRGRRSVTRAGGGYESRLANFHIEALGEDLSVKKNDFSKMTVTARSIDEYVGKWSEHPGEEFILVISGTLILHTEVYKPLTLNVGDSVQFESMTPHAYVAAGDEPTVLLIGMTLPEVPEGTFAP